MFDKNVYKINNVSQTVRQSYCGEWTVDTIGFGAVNVSVLSLRGGNIPTVGYYLIPCRNLCDVWQTADKNTMCVRRFSKRQSCMGDIGYYVHKNYRGRSGGM